MKKIVLLALCAALALAAFVGCTPETAPATPTPGATPAAPGDAPAPPPEVPADPADRIELTIWTYWSQEEQQRLFREFYTRWMEEERPDVEVIYTFLPRADLLMQFTMGAVTGDLPDIGMVDNPDHASFSAMGIFEDITDHIMAWGELDYFFEGPMMSTMYQGRIFGIPNNSNCLALFYNIDMLEAAGVEVPTTWDELEEAAAVLTQGDVFGLAISAVGNEEGTFQFMPWFISAGGSIDDLDGPGAIRAVSFLNGLLEQGFMSRDILNWTQSDANQSFMQQRAAMQVNGPWNIPTIELEVPDLNWGVALLPREVRNASVLGGENFAVCINPGDLDVTMEFMTWFHNAENSAAWNYATGRFPPRSDSMMLRDRWTQDPIFSVFGEALQYAMPRGPHPRWPEISTAISTAFHSVYTGSLSPEEAMAQAAAVYAEIMSE